MSVQVSKKDKNLISLMVLAEFVCKSIIEVVDKKSKDFPYKKMPKAKEEFYNDIKTIFVEMGKKAEKINTEINETFLRIYTKKEMDILMDSVIGVLDLLESQDADRVSEILKATGFKGAEAFFEKAKEEK